MEVDVSPVRSLASLFEANRVAIIGASERNHYAAVVFRNLQMLGFDPSCIVPINPNRTEVFGLKTYSSILDVPGDVPLAVIAVNAKTVVPVVRELGKKRVQAGVVFADGFGEAGEAGKTLQRQLADAANEAGIKILGPNCMGFVAVRAKLGLWGGVLPKSLRPGNIGCVFQSSGMMNLFMNMGSTRGLGFHIAASGGNEAVLNSADYLAYAAECPEIDVIAMFMEAAPREPQRFAMALDRAVANGKSIVMLRAGRTERAQRNVIAHTGQLAGSAAAWDAFFDQHGAVLVNDLDDLIDTAAMFAGTKLRADPHDRGVGLITISGGDCTLLCDIAEQEGVPLPELGPDTQRTLIENLDKPTLLGNPLDVEDLQRQNMEAFDRCLAAFFHEPKIDNVGVRLNLPETITPAAELLYQRIADLSQETDKRVIVLTRATEPIAGVWHERLRSLGLIFTGDYRKSLRALGRLRRNERDRAVGRFEAVARPGPAPARAQLPSGAVLSQEMTAKLLAAYGIAMAPHVMANSADEAGRAADQLGYPCVLKVASVDIPHKTEYGALALGLENRESVRKAYEEILSRVRQREPDAKIAGVLVQQQLRGVECLLGISRDDRLGPVLAIGLGGIFVEVMADVALRVPPIVAAEAMRALDTLKGRAILRGVRGSPPADIDALAEMAARLSWLAHDYRDEIAELDLNPVVVLPQGRGALAVDALLVTREAGRTE